jgi:hypothetical protein
MQPMEQARWQRSPAGRRQNEAALRYWEGLLRTMPPPWTGGATDRGGPRHWEGDFHSPAMPLALRAVAGRTGGNTAPVLLAAYAVAMARVTGVNPVTLRPVVSNRFRPRLADVVGPLSQAGLCVLDVGGVAFDEAVERARRASMTAYKYAYVDPVRVRELVAGIVAERGPEFDVDCFFNDRRGGTDAYPVVPAGQIRQALSRSSFRWTETKDTPSARLFVQVDDVPDATRLNLFADTYHLPAADAEALLREMEAVAVRAATGDQVTWR